MSLLNAARARYESRYIDVHGVRTHYIDAGQGEPVILIHGGGAGADALGNWHRCLPAFTSGFRTIAVDMLGFGATGKPDPAAFEYSQDARNRHLIAFIEALGLRSAHLVGNSMGGATAIGAGVLRPDLVRKVVLMGSAGLNTEINAALLPVVNYDFTRPGMVAVCKALADPSFVLDDDLVDYRYEQSLGADTRASYQATMAWIKAHGGLFYEDDFIRRLSVPTLVVNGKQDLVVPLSNAYRFLELIDNSWGYIIPHCGHWAMLEQPADFAAQSIRFLEAR